MHRFPNADCCSYMFEAAPNNIPDCNRVRFAAVRHIPSETIVVHFDAIPFKQILVFRKPLAFRNTVSFGNVDAIIKNNRIVFIVLHDPNIREKFFARMVEYHSNCQMFSCIRKSFIKKSRRQTTQVTVIFSLSKFRSKNISFASLGKRPFGVKCIAPTSGFARIYAITLEKYSLLNGC